MNRLKLLVLLVLLLFFIAPHADGVNKPKLHKRGKQVGIYGWNPAANRWTAVGMEFYGGMSSLKVVPGLHHSFHVSMHTGTTAADKMFMLVDLSDTTNWPHTDTGSIDVGYVHVAIACDNAFTGEIVLGFLSDVDDTNGDFNHIICWSFTLKNDTHVVDSSTFGSLGHFECSVDNFFGEVTANSTLLQTDVSLTGPDGNTSYPSGNGDLVLFCDVPAGNVEVAVNITYHTGS